MNFQTRYTVRIDDINYGGHMGNERALLIFQDARIRFLKHLGCTEKEIGEGRGIILVEATIRYRKEVFLDDVLLVETSVGDIRKKSLAMRFRVTQEGEEDTALEGETKLLSYNYHTKGVEPLPTSFLDALEPHTEN
ncbi:MAG: acyl-CoA thioesterase [Planctomycetota bacterium]|jgi:acyl-CoA thioester hydrolase